MECRSPGDDAVQIEHGGVERARVQDKALVDCDTGRLTHALGYQPQDPPAPMDQRYAGRVGSRFPYAGTGAIFQRPRHWRRKRYGRR